MNLRRAFEVLDLDRDATIEEAKQAYKDLANIWHPDRFSNNPRLKQKAEEKLKWINAAYDMVLSSLSSREAEAGGSAAHGGSGPGRRVDQGEMGGSKTEDMAETATRMVLSAWSYLSTTLRRFADQLDDGRGEKPASSGSRRDDGRGAGKRKGSG